MCNVLVIAVQLPWLRSTGAESTKKQLQHDPVTGAVLRRKKQNK